MYNCSKASPCFPAYICHCTAPKNWGPLELQAWAKWYCCYSHRPTPPPPPLVMDVDGSGISCLHTFCWSLLLRPWESALGSQGPLGAMVEDVSQGTVARKKNYLRYQNAICNVSAHCNIQGDEKCTSPSKAYKSLLHKYYFSCKAVQRRANVYCYL